MSLSTGYKVKVGNKGIIAIPNIGFDYGIHSDSKFQERGLGVDNRTNKPNSYRSFTSNFGVKLLGHKVFVKNIILTPEVRTSMIQNLHTKKRKIQTKIGINDNYFETKIKNKEKIGFNVGASVVAKIKNKVDISLNYDFYAKRKYQSYLGTCQVKVYF